MATYVISYDLIKPDKDYDRLINHLKSYPSWAHVLKSVWVVETPKAATEVRDAINQHTAANDKVLVVNQAGSVRGAT